MALPTTGLFKIYQTKLYPILDEYLNSMSMYGINAQK